MDDRIQALVYELYGLMDEDSGSPTGWRYCCRPMSTKLELPNWNKGARADVVAEVYQRV